ncbi:hypothetical protein UFOVP75_204 [uncultured Caudovirales phage]|uniref:Uncharacterized protein n=1 Tax=uncultured Caudovirales phage TaxID=2100421 RepID=A0A6J5L2L9_9CAUD|nr:hypothetical protein UFOVP75_204 [uncultured Caudovirales phage]
MNSRIVQNYPCGCSIEVHSVDEGDPAFKLHRCSNLGCILSNPATLTMLRNTTNSVAVARNEAIELEKRLAHAEEVNKQLFSDVLRSVPVTSITFAGDIGQYLQSVFEWQRIEIRNAQDSAKVLQQCYNEALDSKQQHRDMLFDLVKYVGADKTPSLVIPPPKALRKAITDAFDRLSAKVFAGDSYGLKLDTVLNQLSEFLGPLSVTKDSTAEELEQAVADRMTELCDLGVDIAMGVRHEENLTKKEREAAEAVKKLYQERDGARSVLAAVHEEAQHRPLDMSMYQIATLTQPYAAVKPIKPVWNPEVGDKCVNIHNKQQYQIVTFLQNADGGKFVVFMPLIKQAHPDIQSYADFFKNFKELP